MSFKHGVGAVVVAAVVALAAAPAQGGIGPSSTGAGTLKWTNLGESYPCDHTGGRCSDVKLAFGGTLNHPGGLDQVRIVVPSVAYSYVVTSEAGRCCLEFSGQEPVQGKTKQGEPIKGVCGTIGGQFIREVVFGVSYGYTVYAKCTIRIGDGPTFKFRPRAVFPRVDFFVPQSTQWVAV